jgi:hypothetical protein
MTDPNISQAGENESQAKCQVTKPREIGEKVKVRPGEVVTVEAVSANEILLKYTRARLTLPSSKFLR